jgi:hypothetical protein
VVKQAEKTCIINEINAQMWADFIAGGICIRKWEVSMTLHGDIAMEKSVMQHSVPML